MLNKYLNVDEIEVIDFNELEHTDKIKVLCVGLSQIQFRKYDDLTCDMLDGASGRQIVQNLAYQPSNKRRFVDDLLEDLETVEEVDILRDVILILEEMLGFIIIDSPNEGRAKKFLETLNNPSGQEVIFMITVWYLSKKMLAKYNTLGVSSSLEARIRAHESANRSASRYYRLANRGEISMDEANAHYQRLLTEKMMGAIHTDMTKEQEALEEKQLYAHVKKDTINDYILGITEGIRSNLTAMIEE